LKKSPPYLQIVGTTALLLLAAMSVAKYCGEFSSNELIFNIHNLILASGVPLLLCGIVVYIWSTHVAGTAVSLILICSKLLSTIFLALDIGKNPLLLGSFWQDLGITILLFCLVVFFRSRNATKS